MKYNDVVSIVIITVAAVDLSRGSFADDDQLKMLGLRFR